MLGKRSIGHLGVRRRWQGACSYRLGSLAACAEDVSQALGAGHGRPDHIPTELLKPSPIGGLDAGGGMQ